MTVRVLRAFPITVDFDGNVRVVYTARSVTRDYVAALKLPVIPFWFVNARMSCPFW